MDDSRARGFSLLETVIAVAIALVIGWLLVHVLSQMLLVSRLQAQRDAEHGTVMQLVDALTSEEDDAWAIYTPPADALGASNSDGHEVDFFARDGKRQPYFWAYTYDAGSKTLTRYRFASPGGAPVKDVAFTGITAFSAKTYPVTALQDATTPIYSALYGGATLQSGIVHFYPGMPWIAGGNNITYVHFEGATIRRDLELVTQTAPSGFTVVLNYTPSPSPTPGALQAWPAYVELPVGGQALQTAYAQPRRDFGALLNGLLGGSVADALSPCGTNAGRAFQDSSFTTVLANASAPIGAMPAGVTASTDSSGCITINDGNSSNVELYEPGYRGAFGVRSSTCGTNVVPVSNYPASFSGPNVGVRMQGGTNPSAPCSSTWQDTATASVTVGFQVAGCGGPDSSGNYVAVGTRVQCTITYAFLDSGGAECDSNTGITTNGYTGTGYTKFSGPGTWTDPIFTRMGTGSASVTVYSQYRRATATRTKSGAYLCSFSTSYSPTATIVIGD